MRTKTNFEAVRSLQSKYRPAVCGIVSDQEKDLIRTELELDARSDLELQDARDAAVMLYCQAPQPADGRAAEPAACMGCMDAMSAVCAVIDEEKCKRGLPV